MIYRLLKQCSRVKNSYSILFSNTYKSVIANIDLHYGKEAQLNWEKRGYGSFTDYFVDRSIKKIKEENLLGQNIDNEENASRFGRNKVEMLVKRGLKPQNTCVDWGCGSLRVGKELIKYLNANKYYGVDITDLFFKMGLKYVGESIIQEKRPYLGVLTDPNTVEYLKSCTIDYIISTSVLMHIPPAELDTFFSSIISIMDCHTKTYITFSPALFSIKINQITWRYSKKRLKKHVENAGGHADFINVGLLRIVNK